MLNTIGDVSARWRSSWPRRLGGIAVLATLIFVPAVTAPRADAPQVSIGALVPQTGPDARTGANMRAAIQLALQEADYQAGGTRIALHWIDEGDDPATATANYERAIVRDRVQAGLLGWRSDAAVALMPLVARYKIPHLFGFGATELINEKLKSDPRRFGYWTTKIYPVPGAVSGAYAEAITDAVSAGRFKPKTLTVALYAEETDWGRSVVASMKSSFERTGWQVKAIEYFPKDKTDFSALLAKLRTLDVGVVAGTASVPQAAASLVKQYRAADLRALLVVDGLGYSANWRELTGAASDGVLDQEFVFASPEAKRFVVAFKALAGFDPSPFTAGIAYDATRFLLKVLEETARRHRVVDSVSIFETTQAKVWTGELVLRGLVNPEYAYQSSTVPDPVVDQRHFSVPIVQYAGGNANAVWPPALATATLKGD